MNFSSKSNKLAYSKKVAGLEILDPYTLRITLTKTDFNFPMILAYVPTAAVAREVVDKYGGNISRAAKELGLTRASLYRRMEKYDL